MTGCGASNRSCRAAFDEVQNILLGDAATGAGAAHFCEIYIVLAGELAHEWGGADAGIFFVLGSAGGGCGRRSRSFLLCGCRNGWSRNSGFGGGGGRSGSSTAVANYTDDGVDLNSVAFGNLDFPKDAAGGRGDFGIDFVGRNLEQGFVALDLFTGFLQPLGDGSFED